MDENSTSQTLLSEKLVRAALKSGNYGSPKQKSLDFIRNFAQSFRVIEGMPRESGIFSLN